MRALNILAALFAPGAGHVRAGHLRRGIVWIALILLSLPTVRFTPWIPFALYLAQIGDAGFMDEGEASHPLTALGFGLACYVLLVGGALAVRSHLTEMFRTPSGSMIPTLLVGDHFAVDKTVHRARRGEVMTFIHPREPDKDLVKRVIAVGGDTVEVRDEIIYVNGSAVPRVPVAGDCSYQDYDSTTDNWEERSCRAFDETLDGHTYRVVFGNDGLGRSLAPVTVPAGSFFAVGDNRDNSYDSRMFGSVPEKNLKGRALYIWWSRGRDGIRWSRLQKNVP